MVSHTGRKLGKLIVCFKSFFRLRVLKLGCKNNLNGRITLGRQYLTLYLPLKFGGITLLGK
jgi:hypothetical protein